MPGWAVCALALLVVLGGTSELQSKRRPRASRASPSRPSVERGSKENELARLRSEIESFKAQLRDHEQREQRSKRNLSAYDRRTQTLRATINRLELEMERLEEQKSEVDSSLRQTTQTLDQLKTAYAASARYQYMHGTLRRPDSNLFLLAPKKQEGYRKNRYYAHVIGEAHAMNRSKLDSMRSALGHSSSVLASTLSAEERQVGAQTEEAAAIQQKKEEEARELSQIQHDKEKLRKLLQQRMASAKRLEAIIANLLAREEAAREAAKRAKAKRNRENMAHAGKKSKKTREPEIADEEPVGRSYGPHSLSWPSSSHHIKQGFGEHRNAELNTVTVNLGIDIATPSGSTVTAAADGEVALVSSLPSYGTIVVLQHAGGLHTVYADLSGASVRQGMRIKAGQAVGRSGSNEENGSVLHFEVWKGKSKQNPMGWLR